MEQEQKNENLDNQFNETSKEELIKTRNLVKAFIKKKNQESEQRKFGDKQNWKQEGFLPLNDEYSETMASPMEEVESNPRKFIIEECIPACKELWRKNIYIKK